MSDFLKRLSRDPYAPIDGASVTRVDELGNGYDDWGHLIAPKLEAPQQTWGETALGVATAPARLATAVAGSISPYGPNGWQVPPIINEGGDALTAIGDAYTGKMAPEDINSRALGMAGFMMGGGGLAARPAGGTGMFAGRLAKTADQEALARAEKMAAEGADRNAIWNETGWFQGPDKQWRFEIDDSGAVFDNAAVTAKMPSRFAIAESIVEGMGLPKSKLYNTAEVQDYAFSEADKRLGAYRAKETGQPLATALSHQNLFDAYPDAANIGLARDNLPTYSGTFQDNRITFGGGLNYLGDAPKNELSTILHEGQHAIQSREGFARGGNHGSFTPEEIASERARIASGPDDYSWTSVGNASGDMPDIDVGRRLYRRLAGETEARNVQTRMNMSADQRRATPPWETQDIPDADQIVRLYSNSDSRPALLAGALDMSQEARLARAREMGFDTDTTWYHGTRAGADIKEFDPSMFGSSTGGVVTDGVWLTNKHDQADIYGRMAAAHHRGEPFDPAKMSRFHSDVLKLYAPKADDLYVYDAGKDAADLIDQGIGDTFNDVMGDLNTWLPSVIKDARQSGKKGLLVKGIVDDPMGGYGSQKSADQVFLFDPRNIRSVNAAFDPSKSDSADLLAANADSSPALLAGMAGQEETEDGYADGGRVGDLPRPYSIARSMVGQREGRGNDLLNRFLNGDTAGMTSAEYAWCSRFVKQAAAKAGVDVSGATDMARSWLKVGQPVDKPAVGDVVVLSRGNPNSQYGHVGFYEGTDANGNVRILSGNHNNAVASGSYPASRVLGYRRLEGQPDEAYDPATGQQGLKPLAMMDGVGREVPALPDPTPEPSQVADQPKPPFDLTKLASLFAEPEQAQAPQVNFTPIQAFQPQGSPIQASTPYRGTFAHGGQVRGLPDQSEPIHAGPLHSTVPGRTDHLPITVAAGSFVLPADIVSSLGEGNTNAGMEAVSEMFPLPPVRRADGGRVPIAAAGGEYVIAPETVAALGNGDMETGHELLDQFVRRTRAQNIQRLRALPGPEK